MPLRRTPLRRSQGLSRSGKVRPVSDARRSRDDAYRALRAVWGPLGGPCQGAGLTPEGVCRGVGVEVQHKAGRGQSVMLDVATWAALCSPCHAWVTNHPKRSYELGLAVHRNQVVAMTDATVEPFGRCRSCGRPIWWAKVADSGASIPLDADQETREPTDFRAAGWLGHGRIQETAREVDLFGAERVLVAVLGDTTEPGPGPIWRTHFASCPHADQHRRR